MRLSARSSLPRSAHRALHEAKTSFSSRGNMLQAEGEEGKTVGEELLAVLRKSARSRDCDREGGFSG